MGGEIVFCNPPYNKLKLWAQKCYEEFQQGATVVMLVPARTDTQWFHRWIYHKAELRFIEGRLRFGDGKQNAPFPSMVVVFDMKQKVRQAILRILANKRADGEVLPYATSIEVASLLRMSVREVERIAKDIEDVEKATVTDCVCYYQ